MALTNKLSAIGNAIREKTGSTALMTLDAMPAAIAGIQTGGGGSVEVEPIVLTGNCAYGCAGIMGGTYIELFGDTVSTDRIISAEGMFAYYNKATIPFTINLTGNYNYMGKMFYHAEKLKEVPNVLNACPVDLGFMFEGCMDLQRLPENFGEDWNWSTLQSGSNNLSCIFYNCYSLRNAPTTFIKNIRNSLKTSSAVYYCLFYYCRSLDEVKGLTVSLAQLTSNRMASLITNCYRLKDFTFETNEDGTPKTAQWKSQTIDFSPSCGWSLVGADAFKGYGFPDGKEVYDDATYQALKDDPDWWTTKVAYSRYNHDSAVNTINSLPDCSATGTNTIKFKGAAGELTDGGACNTLTEEEIAVATAKGWTVSLV